MGARARGIKKQKQSYAYVAGGQAVCIVGNKVSSGSEGNQETETKLTGGKARNKLSGGARNNNRGGAKTRVNKKQSSREVKGKLT